MRFLFILFLSGTLFASEQTSLERIRAKIKLGDKRGAIFESSQIIKEFPNSPLARKQAIKGFAFGGDTKRAFQLYSLGEEDLEVLESLAWGVLLQEVEELPLSQAAIVGAALTSDVKAVSVLEKGLTSPGAFLRAMSAHFSAKFRDDHLIDALIDRVKRDRVWYVRAEAISALGKMQTSEAIGELKEHLERSDVTIEEKASAFQSLAMILEGIEPLELRLLANHERAGLRQLAAFLISYFEMREQFELLETLLDDASPQVRLEAVRSYALLKEKCPKTFDSFPAVEVYLGFCNKRVDLLEKWAYGPIPEVRRLSALMAGRIGKSGVKLAKELISKSFDPFVRVNAALSVLGQQTAEKECLRTICSFLKEYHGKIMWEGEVLGPSQLGHTPDIKEYPLVIDQQTRLDLLRILAIFRYPGAIETAKQFLKKHTFSVSILIVEEGDSDALEFLSELLKEKDDKIRIGAALVLAMTGSSNEALMILTDAYQEADREMKINILSALGHLGKREVLPFLTKVMGEPHEMLRLVAASAVIQCIYR